LHGSNGNSLSLVIVFNGLGYIEENNDETECDLATTVYVYPLFFFFCPLFFFFSRDFCFQNVLLEENFLTENLNFSRKRFFSWKFFL